VIHRNASSRPQASRSAALAVLCCSFLVLLLPTLVVGASIGEAAPTDELERLQRVITQAAESDRVDSIGSYLFHRAAVADEVWPTKPSDVHTLVVKARLMQLLGMAGITFLVYLAVVLSGSRVQALITCVMLALLPAFSQAGYVLRPETPSTLFALFSLVLLQAAHHRALRGRTRDSSRRAIIAAGLMFCSAAAAALACEVMPTFGLILLVPGVVLLLATVQLTNRGVRCLRRRTLEGTPIRAINARLIPWTAMALLSPAVTLWLLRSSMGEGSESIALTEPASSLIPEGGLLHYVTLALLMIGAVAAVLRVGLKFGKRGRVSPGLILLVYCAVTLASLLSEKPVADPLPITPVAAVLMGEGLYAAMALLLGLASRSQVRRG
jgi:hypothetical protein